MLRVKKEYFLDKKKLGFKNVQKFGISQRD